MRELRLLRKIRGRRLVVSGRDAEHIGNPVGNQVFGDQVMIAPGLPNDLERQSIRAFLSVWVPLYQK